MQDPRSILITGASGGIGGALARGYACPGIALALTGRDPDRLEGAAAACRAAGAEVQAAVLDVRDEAAVRAWVETVDSRCPLDLVVANAGITGGVGKGEALESIDDVRRIMSVNFDGVCNTLHPVVPAMQARGRGQLALIGSLAGVRGMPYAPAYCASKAALKSYGEALRARLRPAGVEVSLVLAGFVDTELSRRVTAWKPRQWTAERAARHIRARLSRGRSLIAFPLSLYVGTRLLATLPAPLADRLLNSVPVEIRPYE